MKVYTKTGDKGRTSLATGKRISKSDLRLEAYGTSDELNSFVGLLRSSLSKDMGDWAIKVDNELGWIQNRLFDVGAVLAGADFPFSEDNVLQKRNCWVGGQINSRCFGFLIEFVDNIN